MGRGMGGMGGMGGLGGMGGMPNFEEMMNNMNAGPLQKNDRPMLVALLFSFVFETALQRRRAQETRRRKSENDDSVHGPSP